ncbi:MAG TPA: sialidase family protein [Thermoanaerobaculia bacterium]|nr:sialidase family protein [Thermoanaerobaculia bacterium]
MKIGLVFAGLALAACSTVPIQVSSGGPGDAALSRCLGSETRFEREPHAAVNPKDPDHIVAAWISASQTGTAIQAAASFDGGRSWTPPVTLPINACSGGPFDFLPRASDPWVAFGPEGRAYVSAIGFQPTDDLDEAGAVLVVSTPDGGRTWDPPGVASVTRTPEFLHDNTAIAADPNRPGTAYVVTTRYQPAARVAPAVMSKTIDGGKSWSPVREITPGSPTAGAPQMVIDPRTGHLFVFYDHGPRGSQVSFVKSEDGGETWSQPVLVAQATPVRQLAKFPGTDKDLRVAEDIQHAAIDPKTGRFYVVLTSEGRHAEVVLTTSDDGGSTWSPLRRVNADPERPAWRPMLAVGPAIFYFAPGGPARGDALPMEVHLVTGEKDVVIDRFDWTPAWNGAYFLGDYHALLVTRRGLLPLYGRSVEPGSRAVVVHP